VKPQVSSPLKGLLSTASIYLVAYLPDFICKGLSKAIVWSLLRMNSQMVRVSKINLAIAFPDLAPKALEKLCIESLQNTVETSFEICKLWIKPPKQYKQKINLHIENEAVFTQLYSAKEGLIIALPHIGNWEVINHYLMEDYPFTALYRAPRIKQLDRIIRGAREQTGAKLVAAGKKGVIHLFRALKNGELTVILPDQEPGKSGGVYASFFGKEAWTMTLLSKLTTKTKARVVFAVVERERFNQDFRIHFVEPENDIYSDDPLIAANSLNKSIEELVTRFQSQFQWSYKRFKKRPGDEPRFY
jgi:Kdo2-lipid IVA lauroyltransferase/acyltransferase